MFPTYFCKNKYLNKIQTCIFKYSFPSGWSNGSEFYPGPPPPHTHTTQKNVHDSLTRTIWAWTTFPWVVRERTYPPCPLLQSRIKKTPSKALCGSRALLAWSLVTPGLNQAWPGTGGESSFMSEDGEEDQVNRGVGRNLDSMWAISAASRGSVTIRPPDPVKSIGAWCAWSRFWKYLNL